MSARPERPTPGPSSPVSSLADFGICLAASVGWTWPLASNLNVVLRDGYDAVTQTWVLAWVRHALLTSPRDLFQANAFAPSRDVLAFSEPLVGYGVLGIPLRSLGLTPGGALNAICILLLAFGAWALCRLALALGAPRGAALLGALAATFCALTNVQLGFVSFTAFGGISWMLAAWLALESTGRRRQAVALGLATAVLGWFSLHLFSFGLVALAALVLVRAIRAPRIVLERLPHLALAGLLAAVCLVPLAVPLLRVRRVEGFKRTPTETLEYSASPARWLTTTSESPGQAFLPFRSGSEMSLYPGTVAILLAGLGLFLWRRPPRLGGLASAGAVVAAAGALGASGYYTPFYPALVTIAPPLFGGIRVAARFAFVVQIGVGLLAAHGAAKLLTLPRRRASRLALGLALVAAIYLDVRQTVSFGFRPETDPPKAETFMKAADTRGPILHLPFTTSPSESRYLFMSLTDFKPIVNGTLSHIPARNGRLERELSERPIALDALGTIERWPVGTIVLHEHLLPPTNRASTLRFLVEGVDAGRLSPPLRFRYRSASDWVFGVLAVRRDSPWGAAGGGDPDENARLLRALAAKAFDLDGQEDPSLPGWLEQPAADEAVSGRLEVGGWGQDRLGPLEVATILIDGVPREPVSAGRTARPDVAQVIPELAPASEAGWHASIDRTPEDAGPHEMSVVLRSKSGHIRTFSRSFVWR